MKKNWKVKKLGEIGSIFNGNSINEKVKKDKYEGIEKGFPFIATKDVGFNNSINYENGVKIPFIEREYFKVAPPNVVLVCAEGGSAGRKIGFTNQEICFGNKLFAFVSNNDIDNKYIYYFFFSSIFHKQFFNEMAGIIGGVSMNKFKGIEIPIPPLPEQHRIVAKIDTLFSELENGAALLKTIKTQLVAYRQAVLKWAFEGKLTNSKLLKEENLKKFIENPRYGTSKKCTSENIATKVYRIPNINYQTGMIIQDDLKYAEFSEDEKESLQLKKDDILIIRSNGSVNLVGRASIVRDVDIDGLFAGYLMRLRIISDNLIPKFLLFYLSSPNARLYIETTAKSTSGVNNINSEEICKLPLPYFDATEQLAIVSAIESRLSVCDKLEQTIDQALALSASLRQSILKKAFEGELVPQDPNDEPGEKLLERIRLEKAAVLAKQKQTQKRGGK